MQDRRKASAFFDEKFLEWFWGKQHLETSLKVVPKINKREKTEIRPQKRIIYTIDVSAKSKMRTDKFIRLSTRPTYSVHSAGIIRKQSMGGIC